MLFERFDRQSHAGEPGDRVQFTEFITANVRLYALRNEQRLSTHAVAHYTRQQLAEALRKVGRSFGSSNLELASVT